MNWRFWRRSRSSGPEEGRRATTPEAPPAPPSPPEIALAYHECTKHHPHRFASSLGYLDWETQPDPFRRFDGAERMRLPFVAQDDGPGFDRLQARNLPAAAPGPREIASFLEFSLALSASKSIEEARWFLRVNPSSGNLHPTEGYVVAGPESGVDGATSWGEGGAVLHYAPEDHALELRTRIPTELWSKLAAGLPPGSFLVGLSSIPWRESWKYGERAYRYCQHDAGHALAALSYSAALLGWSMRPMREGSDRDVARLLGLDRAADFAEAERERPVALAVVGPAAAEGAPVPGAFDPELLEALTALPWFGRANRLSPEQIPWEVIDAAATACEKPATEAEVDDGLPGAPRMPVADRPVVARALIRGRRSAVDLDGTTRLAAPDFFRILERTMPIVVGGLPRPPFDGLPALGNIHLALFVHRVDGLAPGLYALVRRESALAELRASMQADFAWSRPDGTPEGLPLYGLREGDFRGTASSLCCSQAIAGSGVLSLGMIADHQRPIEERGAWWYRWLHWEAGAIGQALYLEAEAAGIRGTGIGCFFDDSVHGTLGMRDRRFQSLYHFTMGGAVDDARLVTGSPYDEARRAVTAISLE